MRKISLDLLFEASENGVALSDEKILEEMERFMLAVSNKVFQKPTIAILQHLECETHKELYCGWSGFYSGTYLTLAIQIHRSLI